MLLHQISHHSIQHRRQAGGASSSTNIHQLQDEIFTTPPSINTRVSTLDSRARVNITIRLDPKIPHSARHAWTTRDPHRPAVCLAVLERPRADALGACILACLLCSQCLGYVVAPKQTVQKGMLLSLRPLNFLTDMHAQGGQFSGAKAACLGGEARREARVACQ